MESLEYKGADPSPIHFGPPNPQLPPTPLNRHRLLHCYTHIGVPWSSCTRGSTTRSSAPTTLDEPMAVLTKRLSTCANIGYPGRKLRMIYTCTLYMTTWRVHASAAEPRLLICAYTCIYNTVKSCTFMWHLLWYSPDIYWRGAQAINNNLVSSPSLPPLLPPPCYAFMYIPFFNIWNMEGDDQ